MQKGDILKRLIKQSRFTQRRVAEALGMHENYLGVLLKKNQIKPDLIKEICDVIQVDYNEHFVEDNNLNDDYRYKYNDLKEVYLTEKSEWLNNAQELIEENHRLKNQVIALTEENFKLKQSLSN